MTIRYRKGYKYVLEDDSTCMTGICPPKSIAWKWGLLSVNGAATILHAYAWDGASGGMLDVKSIMRGTLYHDWFYQMIRLGLLDISFKEKIDDLLHNMCVEDGMIHFVAEGVEEAVSHFGDSSVDPAAEHRVSEAP